MNFIELYEALEKLYSPRLSCNWDNDGVMISTERVISKVLIALDATSAVASYAANNGFDVIITHHPLIFKPLKNISEPLILKLIHDDIGVISFHTRLDAVCGGVNEALCARLGLYNVRISDFDEEKILRIGRIKPCSIDEFALSVKRLLGCPFISAVKNEKTVSRVAVAGGDGKDFYRVALYENADVYVTGAMNYNMLVGAYEDRISVIEAGHFFTENPVCEVLAKKIKEIDNSICTEIFDSNPVVAIM